MTWNSKRTNRNTRKKTQMEREKLNREFVKKNRTGSIPPSCYQACSPTSLSTTGGGSQFYARVTPGYQNMIAKNISIVTSPSSFSFPFLHLLTHISLSLHTGYPPILLLPQLRPPKRHILSPRRISQWREFHSGMLSL